MLVMITEHAYKRIKERMGVNRKGANNIVERAVKKGITLQQTHGNLRNYLYKQFQYDGSANNIRVYNQHIFIINDAHTLVTVLQLPTKFFKEVQKLKTAMV